MAKPECRPLVEPVAVQDDSISRIDAGRPLVGLSRMPVIYVNGIHRMWFGGVNSHFILFADHPGQTTPIRLAAAEIVIPSGALFTSVLKVNQFVRTIPQ